MTSWQCRACRHTSYSAILSLGDLPLATALLDEQALSAKEPRLPLTLIRCTSCGLAQLREEVPREALFRDYCYYSSCSETLVESARALATRIIAARRLNQDSLVLEVASNDGYLLQHYAAAGIRILGVEPARAIAETARSRGIPTLAEFFDLDLARQIHNDVCRPDVIHAHNVLAHVSDIDHIELHGGSLLLRIARVDSPYEPAPAVSALLEDERSLGVNTDAYCQEFASRVSTLGVRLRALIGDCRSQGLTLAGYGAAAAKATQLLNFFDLGPDCIRLVCDISPHKQGKYIPGVRIPIVPPSALLEKRPDVVLLLAWNFAAEILLQQDEFRRRGGKVLIPIPEPCLV